MSTLSLLGSPVLEENTNQPRFNTAVETMGLPLVKKKISAAINGVQGRKRKSVSNKISTSSSTSFKHSPKIRRTEIKNSENKEDQTVPSINRVASGVGAVADLFNLRQGTQNNSTGMFSSSSTTPPPPQVPEFAFSNMMRKMASKYQQNDLIETMENKSFLDHPQE